MLVQEETRLKNQGTHTIHLVSHQGAGKKPKRNFGKGKQRPLKVNESSSQVHKNIKVIDAISVRNLGTIRKIA